MHKKIKDYTQGDQGVYTRRSRIIHKEIKNYRRRSRFTHKKIKDYTQEYQLIVRKMQSVPCGRNVNNLGK